MYIQWKFETRVKRDYVVDTYNPTVRYQCQYQTITSKATPEHLMSESDVMQNVQCKVNYDLCERT